MGHFGHEGRISVLTVLLILVVLVVTCIPLHVTAPAIFSDGFENNNFNAWTGHGGNIATSTAHPHHGTYGATWTAGGAGYCYKTVTLKTTFYMRAYFYFTSVPNTGSYSSLLSIVDSNGWFVSEAWYRVSGGATGFWLYSDNDYQETYTGITISPNTWYCVELASYKSASGWNKMWINGALVASHTLDNSEYGNFVSGYLGAYVRTGAAYTAYGDCSVIDASYIGPEVTDTTPPTYSSISVSNASYWTTKAPLTSPRGDGAAAVYGGKLYYCGGYGANAQDVRTEVYCYDPSTDSWSTKTPMNHATWGQAAAACNGVIYVFGGTTQYTQAYNISTNSWTGKNPPPDDLANINGLMAVTVDNLIYLFGNQFTYEYNPSTNAFTRKTDAPVSRTWATCAYTAVGGENRIYIIGGSTTGGITNVNYYYRPAYNNWSSGQSAPYPAYGVTRDNPASEGLIYYGFGYDASTTFYSLLYAYNATANTWSSALPSASYARDGVSCGVINSKLYVVGGRNVTASPYGVDRNEEYTPASFSSMRTFSCNWTDDAGLSGYIFGTNNTGTFANDSWTAFQTNPSLATVTKTLNTTATAVTYQWWANDTSNNWNNTGTQTLITPNVYTVSVTVLPSSAAGTVTPNATGPYHYNDTIILTESPNPGYTFSGWSGDGSGTGSTRSVNVTGNMAVTATFTQNVYTLTVTTVGSGSVNRNNTGPYHYGDIVQLTAVPAAGWSFSVWSGDLSGSTNPATLVIDSSKTVTATFIQNTYTLAVTMSGSGSVNLNNTGPYQYGDWVQLTASATVGWSFDHWSGDLSGSVNPAAILINGNKSVSATFTQDQYTLSITLIGSGSVGKSPSQATYTWGTNVTLTASAGVGWTFAGWSGDASGTAFSVTINMTGNKAVTATFTQNVYALNVNVVGNGHVDRNNTGPYHYNDVVLLTAVPDSGWSFYAWSGDFTGSVNPYAVTITGDTVVTATFTQNPTMPFSIVSNSTVTQLTFNSTSEVLEFTVTGPSGTHGFTNVTIAKTLITDITNLTVTLDGNQTNYTVTDLNTSWLIYFTYNHSTHRVIMDFASQQTKTSSTPWNAVIATILGSAIIMSTTLAIITKRRRGFSNFTK